MYIYIYMHINRFGMGCFGSLAILMSFVPVIRTSHLNRSFEQVSSTSQQLKSSEQLIRNQSFEQVMSLALRSS